MFAIANENRHLLINGENLEGLKLINGLRYYDFILIDPSCNLGKDNNKSFTYREELGDTWTEEIQQRLVLSKELINETGVVALHVGNKEINKLKGILNKVFGKDNYVNTFTLSNNAESYLIVYSKTNKFKYKNFNIKADDYNSFFVNVDIPLNNNEPIDMKIIEDHLDWHIDRDMTSLINIKEKEDSHSNKMTLKEYFRGLNKIKAKLNNEVFKKSTDEINNKSEDIDMIEWLTNKVYGIDGVSSLNEIKQILRIFIDENSKVCDLYAGNGTTGQAVLELNAEDKGNRVITLITNNIDKMYPDKCYPTMKEACNNIKQELSYISIG